MTIEKMLKTRNVNDQVYLSDVEDWIDFELPFPRIIELRDKISEMKINSTFP